MVGPPFVLQVITCIAHAWPAMMSAKTGLVGRAIEASRVILAVHDLKDFGRGPHRSVDDAPFGGGAGMLLTAPALIAAMAAARARHPGPVIILAPRGRPLAQADVARWARGPGLTLVCGRYEGLDERAYAAADEMCSVGDVVLSGGDPAALCVLDAVVRLRVGTVGNAESLHGESFEDGLLQHPQYTRPAVLPEGAVPSELLSGDHAKIAAWRAQTRRELTLRARPDLWAAYEQSRRAPPADG